MELSDREKCIFLIDNDRLPKSDAIVILEGDGRARIKWACDLYNAGLAENLVFSGDILNIDYGSFPFKMVKEDFSKNGVSPEHIIIENKSQNTREQGIEILKMCHENDWNSIILVASHYHQFRAFLTFLKVLIEEKLENKIGIYNSPVRDLSWFEENPWGSRFELLSQEFSRIDRYSSLGHLASFKEAINYFRWKDSRH